MKLRDRLLVACFIVMCLLGSWRFGGGQIARAAVPSGDYGPVNGRDFVVANAIPLQPSQPAGAISVSPGGLTQTFLNNNPGATFWLLAGTHSVTSGLAPHANQKIYCAAGAVVDGASSSSGFLVSSSATGWQLHGGTWRNQGSAASPASATAIMVTGGATAGNILLQDLTVTSNFNRGIHIQRAGVTVRRCETSSNGRYGVTASKNQLPEPVNYTNILLDRIHNFDNNTRNLDHGADAGGSKFSHGEVVVQDSYFHDDHGFSAWWDVASGEGRGNSGITGSVVENSERSGIFLEGVSGGSFVIRNYLLNNGRDVTNPLPNSNVNNVQIRITDADCSLGPGIRGNVSRNDIDWTLTATSTNPGWALILWNHDGHPDRCKNWDVKNNRFWFRNTAQPGLVGGRDTATSGTEMWAGNNVFDANEYRVESDTVSYWRWDTGAGTGAVQTWAAWQGFGHDGAGTRVLI